MNFKKQVDELKKVIESAHVNFLFGSGASKPFLDTLGNIENNLAFVDESTLENVLKHRDLLKASIFIEYLNKCLFGNLFFDKEDISDYKKGCVTSENNKADDFLQVKKSYEDFISNISKLLSSRDIQLLSKQVNIFTTNVDVFFEESLEMNKCNFNDGFGGRKELIFDTTNFHNTINKLSAHYEYKSEIPHVNLFKVHGSLNWIKSTEKSKSEYNISADYSLKTLKKLYKMTVENHRDFVEYSLIDNAIKESNFNFLDAHVYKIEKVKSFLDLYHQVMMINPTKQKFEDTTKNVHYYEMLRMYANHLERENSVLFVLGFSFADEHIQKITQRVAKSNPTLRIYILCAGHQRESFEEIFKFYLNVKYIIPKDGYYSLEELNRCFSEIIKTIPSSSY